MYDGRTEVEIHESMRQQADDLEAERLASEDAVEFAAEARVLELIGA